MKKENIGRAYILQIKIKELKKFLKTKKMLWGILTIKKRYLLQSAHGVHNCEIEADSKLSELVTEAIEKRIEMYRDELRNLGVEVDG